MSDLHRAALRFVSLLCLAAKICGERLGHATTTRSARDRSERLLAHVGGAFVRSCVLSSSSHVRLPMCDSTTCNMPAVVWGGGVAWRGAGLSGLRS